MKNTEILETLLSMKTGDMLRVEFTEPMPYSTMEQLKKCCNHGFELINFAEVDHHVTSMSVVATSPERNHKLLAFWMSSATKKINLTRLDHLNATKPKPGQSDLDWMRSAISFIEKNVQYPEVREEMIQHLFKKLHKIFKELEMLRKK